LLGDGKFERSTLPTNIKMQVARVDLANLTAFRL
jgi:hypothetical protein